MTVTAAASPPRLYSPAARMLHWLTALCVAVLVPVGLAMTRTPEGAFTNALYEIHKSFGIVIFVVMMARLAVRLAVGAPPPAEGLTSLERVVSKVVHVALYVLLVAMPIGGYAATSSCCAPVALFWVLPMPFAFSLGEEATKTVFKMHETGAFVLIGLVIFHLAGVINHALVRRDDVLARMWPR
jgi:cytochrome b561